MTKDRKYTVVVTIEFDAADDQECIAIARSFIGVGLRTTDKHRPVRYPIITTIANLTGVKTVEKQELYVVDTSHEPPFPRTQRNLDGSCKCHLIGFGLRDEVTVRDGIVHRFDGQECSPS